MDEQDMALVTTPTTTPWSEEYASKMLGFWSDHYDSMMATFTSESDDPRQLWQYVAQNKIIQNALNDLPRYDTSKSQAPALLKLCHCLALAFSSGRKLIARKKNLSEDADDLDLLARGVVPVIEAWWSTSRKNVQQWLGDESFDKRVSPYVQLAYGVTMIFSGKHEESSPLNPLIDALRKSLLLQEFFFTVVIVGCVQLVRQAAESFCWLVEGGTLLLQNISKDVIGNAPALSQRMKEIMYLPSAEIPPLNIRLIKNLLKSSVFKPLLTENEDLCVDMVQFLWAQFPMWIEKRGAGANDILLDQLDPVITLIDGTEAQVNRRLNSLLVERDFSSLIAKWLYLLSLKESSADDKIFKVPDSPNNSNNLMEIKYQLLCQELPRFCEQQPKLLKDALLRHKNYLIILDQLRSSPGKNGASCALVWERLGIIAGLQESVLRAEAVAARRNAAGGLVGCSWYKCVMYRQESDQLMHWCVGCKKVVYCGYFCKTRDWDEGHKDVCKNETALAVRR